MVSSSVVYDVLDQDIARALGAKFTPPPSALKMMQAAAARGAGDDLAGGAGSGRSSSAPSLSASSSMLCRTGGRFPATEESRYRVPDQTTAVVRASPNGPDPGGLQGRGSAERKGPRVRASDRGRRHSLQAILGSLLGSALALSPLAACSVLSPGPCPPSDPVVTPEEVVAGGELKVSVPGLVDDDACAQRIPSAATYEVQLWQFEGGGHSVVGTLNPDTRGEAEGAVQVPLDFPVGDAVIRVKILGAKLRCETSESDECARSEAMVRVSAE